MWVHRSKFTRLQWLSILFNKLFCSFTSSFNKDCTFNYIIHYSFKSTPFLSNQWRWQTYGRFWLENWTNTLLENDHHRSQHPSMHYDLEVRDLIKNEWEPIFLWQKLNNEWWQHLWALALPCHTSSIFHHLTRVTQSMFFRDLFFTDYNSFA